MNPNEIIAQEVKYASTMEKTFVNNFIPLENETSIFSAKGITKTGGYFSGTQTAIVVTN